jgi:hypothetical protein
LLLAGNVLYLLWISERGYTAMVLKGGSKAKDGLYWKKGDWEIVTVEGENGALPGSEDLEYLHIPGILFAPVALILGLGFFLFLPFIGFGMLVSVVVRKIGRMLASPETSRPEHVRPGGGVS